MTFSSPPLPTIRRPHLITLLSLAVVTASAHAAEYAIQPLGLTDPTHTLANKLWSSNVTNSNAEGDIAGTSRGTQANDSQTDAWLYSAATRKISLISLPNSTFSSLWGTSAVNQLNASGDAVGFTQESQFTTMQAAWLYDNSNGTTTRIGLTDPVHVNPNQTAWFGQQSSNVSLLNVNGQAVGTSLRYSLGNGTDGEGGAGTDAWFYDKHTGTTVQIGLTGGSFLGGSNQTSGITAINASGITLGYSYKYTGTTRANVATGWIYNPSSNTTSQLTLPSSVIIPPAYPNTGSLAFQGTPINDAGDISVIAAGPANAAATQILAYLYNPTSGYVHQMGLTSSFYQNASGNYYSLPYYLSSAGTVAGLSQYYNNGSTAVGADAWFFDKASNTTYPTGLTSSSFTSPTGARNNVPAAIDPSGQHLVGLDSFGSSRVYWEYDNATHQTSVVGFATGNFLSSTNSATTNFVALNARGQSIGNSFQYNGGSSSVGAIAWIFNPATASSSPIGPSDPLHTDPQGYPRSSPAFLNDNGIVVGTSLRYINGVSEGTDGWYFDSNSNTTTTFNLSTDSNGNAKTNFKFLAPNGIALGAYEKYSGATDLGQFAFLYDPVTGPVDLNLNVANLADNGWQYLQSATAMLASGQILGVGHLANASSSNLTAFLLSPVSPGDANLDGSVDLSDLSIVLSNFGAATPSWTSGNFDGQPTIDLTDLADVLNNFGQTNPNASTAPAATPTPEPTTLLLMLAPAVWSSAFRRRRLPMRSEA